MGSGMQEKPRTTTILEDVATARDLPSNVVSLDEYRTRSAIKEALAPWLGPDDQKLL
jgi:hypothetical protein